MQNPIQPTDRLIDEAAKRVVYKGLLKLDEELSRGAAVGSTNTASTAVNYEKLDTYSNVVAAGCAAMMDPDYNKSEIE